MLKPRRHFEGVSSESVEQLAGSGRAMAASLKCDSYICNFSIHRSIEENKNHSFRACSKQLPNPITQFHEFGQRARWPGTHLMIPGRGRLKKIHQVTQA